MGQYRYLTSIFERFRAVYTEVMLEVMDLVAPLAPGKDGLHPENVSALSEVGDEE